MIDMNSSTIMPDEVIQAMRNIVTIGAEKYGQLLDKRIFSQKTTFTAPIKQTKVKLFSTKLQTARTKINNKQRDNNSIASRILLASNAGRDIPHPSFLERQPTSRQLSQGMDRCSMV
jgi:hypothetical protein